MQSKVDVDQLLMDSFKELVLQVPVEKITIKEITDKAGVIRPTFYNHFQDKYEIIERIIAKDIIAPMTVLLESDLVAEAITLLFANIQKDGEYYKRLSKMEGQNSLQNITRESVKNGLLQYISKRLTLSSGYNGLLTPVHLAEYYAQAVCYVIFAWLQSDMQASPHEMSELCEYLMSNSMFDAIRDLEKV